MSDFKPHRVPPRWFKPCPETIWTAPDAWPEDLDREDIPGALVSMASAYCELLTHPCGVEMLKRARHGWKAIQSDERARGTT